MYTALRVLYTYRADSDLVSMIFLRMISRVLGKCNYHRVRV